MGGFRCTYRNCTVRSDGQTHMFHYPVFDKPRCHKWLVNAQKLEFLELKVSQLKNRVLCQHHFKDECFMNFKKDKLKFDAVPTEDGPFCDSTYKLDVKTYPIIPEDIEKEVLSSNEKRANFSVKYGDFLVNSDLGDSYSYTLDDKLTAKKKETSSYFFPYYQFNKKVSLPLPPNNEKVNKPSISVPPLLNDGNKIEITIDNINQDHTQSQPKYFKPVNKNIRIIAEKKISTPVTIKGKMRPVSPSMKIQVPKKENIIVLDTKASKDEVEIEMAEKPSDFNVKVLTELTKDSEIKDQTAHQETFSNLNLEIQPALQNIAQNSQQIKSDTSLTVLTMDDIEKILNESPQTETKKAPPNSLIKRQSNQVKSVIDTSPSISIKNKMPPERIAAIEQKRKLNKLKLCDMIEFCLDEIEVQDKKLNNRNFKDVDKEKSIETEKSKLKHKGNPNVTYKNNFNTPLSTAENSDSVMNQLLKNPNLPSIDEFTRTIASLESRLQKMESTLLGKIENNSQKISELKCVMPKDVGKKSIATQTFDKSENEEMCKKRLYNEISKYLSPDANSLIYEELFINKFVENVGCIKGKLRPVENTTPKKRQRLY